jgi:hypothetical protein
MIYRDGSLGDSTCVWAYGADGWYMAKGVWNKDYAKDLRDLGYDVERSQKKPTRKGKPK